jgi:hypothetical protein
VYNYPKRSIIANEKLQADKLENRFKDESVFELADIVAFYNQFEPDVKPTTINWRVHTLVQTGVLQRIGRGKFSLGKGKNFSPEITPQLKSIYKKIKKEFPYLNVCIWNTSTLNEFMLHQPNRFYYLVEVEKEALDSVFYFLRETKFAVFLEPTSDILQKYLPDNKEIIIVKTLVSEAPLLSVNAVNTASIEKILVDIFCDDVIFSAQQGSELRTTIAEAFTKYTLNQSKMFRYADRRGKKAGFSEFVNSIANFRQ